MIIDDLLILRSTCLEVRWRLRKVKSSKSQQTFRNILPLRETHPCFSTRNRCDGQRFLGNFVVILALVAGALYFVFLLVYNLVWFWQNTQPRRTQLQATAWTCRLANTCITSTWWARATLHQRGGRVWWARANVLRGHHCNGMMDSAECRVHRKISRVAQKTNKYKF